MTLPGPLMVGVELVLDSSQVPPLKQRVLLGDTLKVPAPLPPPPRVRVDSPWVKGAWTSTVPLLVSAGWNAALACTFQVPVARMLRVPLPLMSLAPAAQ